MASAARYRITQAVISERNKTPKDISLNWTDWKPITEPCQHKGFAAYKIALFNQSGAIEIARFLENDPSGILSIGMATNMESRRKRFDRGSKEGQGHSEANLLHILRRCSPLLKRYPDSKCFYSYSYVPVASRNEATQREREEIKRYVMKFGEAPPLNCAIPDRYNHAEWNTLFRKLPS